MAKKKEVLNASVSYKGEGELIKDVSNEPFKKVETKKKKVAKKKVVKKEVKKIEIIKESKTEKDIFTEIYQSGQYFYLKNNGSIIYDSEKNKDSIIIFQNHSFIIDDKQFSYDGTNLKFN
jgi:hypothetical protein